MPQLITIGETMAAFTPDSVGALRYVQNFGIRTAGAESNVAVGLAKLGRPPHRHHVQGGRRGRDQSVLLP